MKVRPLVIDDDVRSSAAEIMAFAKAHVMKANDVEYLSTTKDRALAVGNDPIHRMMIPFGYRVVYNLEEQPCQGLCHHVSISVEEEVTPTPPAKILPSEEAVNAILELFGMNEVHKCLFIWVEDIEDGGGGAINILDKVKEAK